MILVSWCFEPSQPLGIISGLKEEEQEERKTVRQTDREKEKERETEKKERR